jgi:transcriptional regulator with XRE-family HTH domain
LRYITHMARRKRNIPPEIAHVLARLKLAIQALGYSMRDIEPRLKVSDGYLSRVFLGAIELKIEHVIGIAKALGMAPEELMAFVYPTPKEPISPSAYALWRRVGGVPPVAPGFGPKPAPPPPEPQKSAVTEADAERLLRQALGRVFGDLASSLGKQVAEAGETPPEKPQG